MGQGKPEVSSPLGAPPRPAVAPLGARLPSAAAKPGPPPPAPPSGPPPQAKTTRRSFFKVLLTFAALLTAIPFVPWGQFLSSSVSSSGTPKRQKVTTDINKFNGAASGKPVNVNDLATFPPNSSWLVTYPSSGNLTLDSQNPDTFVKWRLIRMPSSLGGDQKAATAFVAFSEVCVHLWCSPNYDPENSNNPADETYQCPCHGSVYRLPDALSIAGPASTQPPPTNAEPMLTLTADPDGSLYIEPAVFDVNHNGVVGYGRYYQSYESFIKPAAESGKTAAAP